MSLPIRRFQSFVALLVMVIILGAIATRPGITHADTTPSPITIPTTTSSATSPILAIHNGEFPNTDRQTSCDYLIVWGDTLGGIASRYGTTYQVLQVLNHIADPNVIYAGNHLNVCPGTTTVPSPARGDGTDYASEKAQVDAVFGSYAGQAERIVQCESQWDTYAWDPIPVLNGHAEGLFQIIDATWLRTSQGKAGDSRYDPNANIAGAYEIFSGDGYSWREWSCQP